MSLVRYHLVVVGAGSAGLASASFAAELGARVALVERHRLGGDRLRYRLPATSLIRAVRAREMAMGDGGSAVSSQSDFASILQQARRRQDAAAAASGAESLRDLGVDLFKGEARFVAGDAVEVDGRRLEFGRAIIATGARTAIPRIDGLGDVPYKTPETLFELTERPSRFGVVGAGSRGCEMAQAFAKLGCKVQLFAASDRLLPGRDPDAAAIVAEALCEDGVELHMNCRPGVEEPTQTRAAEAAKGSVFGIRRQSSEVQVLMPGDRGEVAVDELLLATGPTPNVEGLGLEAAGVEYDLSGIDVDSYLRTTNRRIFAAGAVMPLEVDRWRAQPPGLAVDADARMAVRNALLFRRLERRRRTVPRATYTRPEIARVGIGMEEAAAATKSIETLTIPLSDADRGEVLGSEGSTRRGGFLRLHLRRRGGEILGGTLVADRAAELIGPLAMAVGTKMRLRTFAEIPLPHPTRSEIYRRAAFAWRRQKTPFSQWISLWLKLTSWS